MCTSKHRWVVLLLPLGTLVENLSYPELLLTGSLSHCHPSKPHQAIAERWNSGTFVLNLRCPRIADGGAAMLQNTPQGAGGSHSPAVAQRASGVFYISFPLQSEILDSGGAWEESLESVNSRKDAPLPGFQASSRHEGDWHHQY